ncbi:MAG: glycosyltransferase family 39 protein [Myxococcota bacterium]
MTAHARPGAPPWWSVAALVALLGAYGTLGWTSLLDASVTVDEFAHLPAGVNLLETCDTAYAQLNPPAMNVLNALAAATAAGPEGGVEGREAVAPLRGQLAEPPGYDFWANGYAFMAEHAASYHRIFTAARLATLAVGALLGILLFAWARRLAPRRPELAGLLAAGLVLLSPNLLAHARLVTTDVACAAAMALALFALDRHLRQPGWGRALGLGLAIGLAQLVKFTAVHLYPVVILAAAFWHVLDPRTRGRRLAAQVAVALGVSGLVVQAGYGFQGTMRPLGGYDFVSEPFQLVAFVLPEATPVPLPEAYVEAFDRQTRDVRRGDPSYLLGESYHGGRWDYFAVLIGYKTPLPVLVLALFAVALALRRRGVATADLGLVLLLPAGLVLAVQSLAADKQLGLRMILPALPLAALWVAVVVARGLPARGLARGAAIAVLVALIAWGGGEASRAWPHYLAYFNPLAGDRDEAWRIAVDSNLDWGQGLPALRRAVEAAGGGPVQLMYFGRVDPAIYGLDYTVPRGDAFAPGLVAVSATLLGRGWWLYDHGRLIPHPNPVDPVAAGLGEPIAAPGHGLLLFRVPESGSDAESTDSTPGK